MIKWGSVDLHPDIKASFDTHSDKRDQFWLSPIVGNPDNSYSASVFDVLDTIGKG